MFVSWIQILMDLVAPDRDNGKHVDLATLNLTIRDHSNPALEFRQSNIPTLNVCAWSEAAMVGAEPMKTETCRRSSSNICGFHRKLQRIENWPGGKFLILPFDTTRRFSSEFGMIQDNAESTKTL